MGVALSVPAFAALPVPIAVVARPLRLPVVVRVVGVVLLPVPPRFHSAALQLSLLRFYLVKLGMKLSESECLKFWGICWGTFLPHLQNLGRILGRNLCLGCWSNSLLGQPKVPQTTLPARPKYPCSKIPRKSKYGTSSAMQFFSMLFGQFYM